MIGRGKRVSLVGQRFGRLTVVSLFGRDRHRNRMWACSCDCGARAVVRANALSNGHAQSCGCRSRELAGIRLAAAATKHGASARKGRSPEYRLWINMRRRCEDHKSVSFKYYGARGIGVCDRWQSFENFRADMGERPAGMQLDRYPNNDGNYEPGNCRWATPKQNCETRRRAA